MNKNCSCQQEVNFALCSATNWSFAVDTANMHIQEINCIGKLCLVSDIEDVVYHDDGCDSLQDACALA